ncbi:MAG: heavy-metal-associated domain-containing protein [Muribaculaceae bacterium]|nr:heavy-metal-associated domain-containing protein [Muribaculaceae bacterium]
MKIKTMIAAAAIALMTASAPATAKEPQKEATAVFTVSPKMSCQNCEKKIKSNIRFEKGVKSIATSLENQTVTIDYNPSKTSPDKIAAAFKKIGYKATEAKAPAKTEKK